MTQPSSSAPPCPASRLLGAGVAAAASYLPDKAMQLLLSPCVRCVHTGRPPRLVGPAIQTIDLIVGEGLAHRLQRRGGPDEIALPVRAFLTASTPAFTRRRRGRA